MTDFIAWIPPAGYAVDPPVHPMTVVDVIYNDRSEDNACAANLNWSGEGDGPKIIAYSVVLEWVEPVKAREGWVVAVFETARQAKQVYPGMTPFLVREVLGND